jgi:hypothetical protein
MKYYTIAFFLCTLALFSSAQTPVPSPEKFLGYALGAHFTPHFRIVNYFKEVAQSAAGMMKLEQYGQTNEGRPLLLAYIALPENLQKLESIRQNNLRLAGVLNDKTAADENAPAIVWLSYNVHGNEPSSSEASMKTLYELVNPDNKQTKEWLKDVVVIIDPCINPDGRDRYVNWYNSVVGKIPDPEPSAREHNEPWPAGRSNHYNFDLNRDWAWQTQIETQQRLKKYNEWFPQVHVDYHEQGFNSPYYFAPAAEPYHEVITPWQRQFQQMIGKNNAKYFDQNGWLYFTKERFDLFYPSYGDTYPLYNGAIGMTFEQGGIRAGLAVITQSGDTLTLYDRLLHHFTTGMSTIEISALNKDKLIKEFHKYFLSAKATPYGEFKSYVIKNENDGKLDEVKTLLTRNLIDWEYAALGNFSGFNYETRKQEIFKTEAGDIVINCNQPKSNLIKVLFERNSKISDSVTYDITAWAVPFVYGVHAYGAGVFINGIKDNPQHITNEISDNGYGYAANWSSFNSAKFLAILLKKGVKVRYADQPFESGGKKFEKGTLLVIKTSNHAIENNLAQIVSEAAKTTGVTVSSISSGFVDKGYDFGSGDVHFIHTPVVAMLTGTGVSSSDAGEVWHLFEQQLDYPITLVNADDIGRINWKNINVLIMPDGNYKFLTDKNSTTALKEWIRQGGKLIAVQNAVQQLAAGDWGIKAKENAEDKKDNDENKKNEYSELHKYETRQREQLANSTPGSIYKVELDNSHPLAFGYPNYYYTLKQDENVYNFLKDGGWNVGVIKKDNYVSGFTGSKVKEKMKDALVFGVQESGRGEIIYMADNPLFRSFWENGKLLFCNAVFLVGE